MSRRAQPYADEFLRAWAGHYVPEAAAAGQPSAIDLPDDWRTSVAGFHGAGLPQAAMLDAVAITIEREDVTNEGLFRYFCGVCWHMIRAARDEPRSPASAVAPPMDELPKLPRTIVRKVACPACGAAAGERCIGTRDKPRERNHAERVLAAAAAAHGAGFWFRRGGADKRAGSRALTIASRSSPTLRQRSDRADQASAFTSQADDGGEGRTCLSSLMRPPGPERSSGPISAPTRATHWTSASCRAAHPSHSRRGGGGRPARQKPVLDPDSR